VFNPFLRKDFTAGAGHSSNEDLEALSFTYNKPGSALTNWVLDANVNMPINSSVSIIAETGFLDTLTPLPKLS
jgi:hypothetical protein